MQTGLFIIRRARLKPTFNLYKNDEVEKKEYKSLYSTRIVCVSFFWYLSFYFHFRSTRQQVSPKENVLPGDYISSFFSSLSNENCCRKKTILPDNNIAIYFKVGLVKAIFKQMQFLFTCFSE
jgi:hypothetical protein